MKSLKQPSEQHSQSGCLEATRCLVERPNVPTAMQLEKEGPQGQSAKPTNAHHKSGAAAKAGRTVMKEEFKILGL